MDSIDWGTVTALIVALILWDLIQEAAKFTVKHLPSRKTAAPAAPAAGEEKANA